MNLTAAFRLVVKLTRWRRRSSIQLTAAFRLGVQLTRWRWRMSSLSIRRRPRNRPADIVIPVYDYSAKYPLDDSLDPPLLPRYRPSFPSGDLLDTPLLPPLSPLIETETEIPRRIHEVFLSFRGEDTRANFISHLQHALQNAAINVFKDDDSIERGNIISDSLLQAIEDSKISVVVFSTSYADSRWCLEELAKIMD